MPSPKHGFFDEENFMVRSTLDTIPFQLRSPDVSSDPDSNAFIRRNVPGARKKIGSPLTKSLHFTPSTRPQHSMHSAETDTISTLPTGIRNSKNTEEKRKSMSKNKIGKEGKDQKAQIGNLLDTMKPVKKDREAAHELLLESDSHFLCESKENFKDQVKDLSKYFEALDLAGNAAELDSQKSNSRAQDESLDGAHFACALQQDSPSITRIPFGNKNSACHKSRSLQLSTELPTSSNEVSTLPSSDSAKEDN